MNHVLVFQPSDIPSNILGVRKLNSHTRNQCQEFVSFFADILSVFFIITPDYGLLIPFSLFLFIYRSRINSLMRRSTCSGLKDVCELGSLRSSIIYPEKSNNSGFLWRDGDSDDLCQIDMDDLCNISSLSNNVLSQSTGLNKVINLYLPNFQKHVC